MLFRLKFWRIMLTIFQHLSIFEKLSADPAFEKLTINILKIDLVVDIEYYDQITLNKSVFVGEAELKKYPILMDFAWTK